LGNFTVELYADKAPVSAENFLKYVDEGFFDGTVFHRIVPGFVIQGGDPTATGTGGPGYTTVDKPPATAAYTLGVVAMAKTTAQPPGAAGSQFFVVTVANAGLPADYAIIGKVTSGLDVVQRIGKLGTPNSETGAPTEVVEIEKATVSTS
jgi:cyclophilin family peptidyl-prolyl cis-trans isomerase